MILLLGCTGMVGQGLCREARRRTARVLGAARHKADVALDVRDEQEIVRVFTTIDPEIVINAAAVADVELCEEQPHLAHAVNAQAVAVISRLCRESGAFLVHLSTDHYFTGDGRKLHDEGAPVRLVNSYARTKHAGELFALEDVRSLVVRTNVTGFRGWPGKLTFAEWVFDGLEKRRPMHLFTDFHTSTVDVASFSRVLFDLIERRATGLLNVAAREVASKKDFVVATARRFGVTLDWAEDASVRSLRTPRAESLGLDVSKCEGLLGYAMPALDQVVASLCDDFHRPEAHT